MPRRYSARFVTTTRLVYTVDNMRNRYLRNIAIWTSIAVVVITVFVLGRVRNSILTGQLEDVLSITVHVTPASIKIEPTSYIIANKEDIDDFISTLRQGVVHIKLHPAHWQSLQCDFDAKVQVLYSDGSSDELLIKQYGAFRILNTCGSNGDPGYIFIDNQKIYIWIENHTPD